jgi:glutamate-1-semialdehyde aminotransferase
MKKTPNDKTELLNYARQERNLFVELLKRNPEFLNINQSAIENFFIAYDNLRNEIADANEIKRFAESVQKMRNAQKAYFQTRAPQTLQLAKDSEKKVDDTVKTILEKEVKIKQAYLRF